MKKIGAAILIIMIIFPIAALADTGYVICDPSSYVVIRATPSRHGEVIGYLDLGDELDLTGQIKNGYARINILNEINDGWVSTSNICKGKPETINAGAKTIKAGVRFRKSINGEVRKKVKKGTDILVYVWAEDWCFTNMGYVKTEMIEVNY